MMNDIIRTHISEAALYEQLAEECTELAKASLKKARILRGENPTPVTNDQADTDVREEYTDVIQCARELDLSVDEKQIIDKTKRWEQRIGDSELFKLPENFSQHLDFGWSAIPNVLENDDFVLDIHDKDELLIDPFREPAKGAIIDAGKTDSGM